MLIDRMRNNDTMCNWSDYM